jgi:prepilin-type processing-associated H-X9-DG protein
LNANCKGNVSFCDGHADYVTRAFVDDPNYPVTGDNLAWDPAAN